MIPLFRPVIDVESALANLRQVFESGWLGLGQLTERFEQELGKVIGARHVVATNSCTSALHLAVRTLGLPRGARVLTTPITFVSTNAVLLYEGLTPVFCDVDRWTGNLTPDSLAYGMKHFHPAAIMVVHLGGYPCDMDAINEIAGAHHNIPVIEDCAHALGAMYKGRPVGSGANVCCWSFHAVKNLPMGDGGAVSTQDANLAARLRRLRWLGIDKSTADRTKPEGYTCGYNGEKCGYKYHMNDVAAAIGLAQLPHLEEQNKRRNDIANRYICDIKNAMIPEYGSTADFLSAYHFLPLFFKDRDRVAEACRAAGIATGHHYARNDRYGIFRSFPTAGDLSGAEWYDAHELTLPLHVALADEEIGAIIQTVNGADSPEHRLGILSRTGPYS